MSARRTKVANRRGIYFREGADGRRRYEISYLDSDGRRRWQTVEGGLKDAEAALEDLRGRKRKGERVSPSKATFGELADAWLAAQSQLRPRTRQGYEIQLRKHVVPRLGRLRIADVREDDIAALIAGMRADGYAPWTIRGVLTPLGRVLSHAARRGLIPSNPMRRLERGERPTVERHEMRILTREEIGTLLGAADEMYRPLLATAVFTGVRLGELLGLTWGDIDLDAGTVRVRKSLDLQGKRVSPKTAQAVRDVKTFPALGRVLREHKLRSPAEHVTDRHPVFATRVGTHMHARNVRRRGLEATLARADLGRLRFHDLRHTFASLLVAQGENVVYVSRQLGHASPDITLRVYAHLFDQVEHAQRASDRLEASFGNVLETSGGNQGENRVLGGGGEVVDLRGFRD